MACSGKDVYCCASCVTNRTELCGYFTMVGYMVGIDSLLTDLLIPKVQFYCTAACQTAFEQTTGLLLNATCSIPFDSQFELAVDMTDIGTVLL